MNSARIELHLHLDGSLNIRKAYQASLEQKIIPENTSFSEYYAMLYRRDYKTREEGFQKFDLVCAVLQTYKDLYAQTYDLVRRLADMGLFYAEIRFASQQHTLKGLSQYEALEAVIDGAHAAMHDYPGINVGILNCLMHKGENALFNWQENLETIEVTEKLLHKGAVGLDLAGYENNGDFKLYGPLFEIARKKNIPFTVHAGEMGEADHILDAIDFGARRIGHGIDAVKDEKILKILKEKKIPLEVCVGGNIRHTGNYSTHPIHRLWEYGILCTLNTDNMIFSLTNTVNEHAQLRLLGIEEEKLIKTQYIALDAAFCDKETKEKVRRRLDTAFRKTKN